VNSCCTISIRGMIARSRSGLNADSGSVVSTLWALYCFRSKSTLYKSLCVTIAVQGLLACGNNINTSMQSQYIRDDERYAWNAVLYAVWHSIGLPIPVQPLIFSTAQYPSSLECGIAPSLSGHSGAKHQTVSSMPVGLPQCLECPFPDLCSPAAGSLGNASSQLHVCH
jgi:hypothetical protein